MSKVLPQGYALPPAQRRPFPPGDLVAWMAGLSTSAVASPALTADQKASLRWVRDYGREQHVRDRATAVLAVNP